MYVDQLVNLISPLGKYQSFPYTIPGALFTKSMLLDTDFLNSAPGLYTENSQYSFCMPTTSSNLITLLGTKGSLHL